MAYERLTPSHDTPVEDEMALGVDYYGGNYIDENGKVKTRIVELRFREVYNRLLELEDKIEDGDLIFITKDVEPRIIVDEDHNVAMITNGEKIMPYPPNVIMCNGYNYVKGDPVYAVIPGTTTVEAPLSGIKERK